MSFALVLVVLSAVECIKSVFCAEDKANANNGQCPPGIHLSTYGVYLIGFAMLLMFLAIVYLTYALIKAKGQQYKIISDISQYETGGKPTTFTRQESQIPICPNTAPLTPVEDVIVEDSFFPKTDNCTHLERNGASTSTINKYESRVLPIVKKSMKNSSLMLPPEQMREICKGVLQNRKSNKDLLDIVDSFERRPRKLSKKGLPREKSASTPALDLITQDDIYDVLPSNKGSTNNLDDDDDDTKINSKESNIKELTNDSTTSKDGINHDNKSSDNKPSDNLDDVYDCPGASTTKKIIVEDKEYLIVIDPAHESDTEPSYTNAKTNEYIL